MSVRSAARGNPAAKSIRFALRTSSIVATSSANFSRCVLRWLGSRRLRSALMLSAIRVMPSTTQVLGPLKVKSLNHTPTPAVNPDLSETDGWQAPEPNKSQNLLEGDIRRYVAGLSILNDSRHFGHAVYESGKTGKPIPLSFP